MKYFSQIIFLLFSIHVQSNELAMLSELTSLRWEKRIILVNEVESKQNISVLFEKSKTEINDRDIVWFIIKENYLSTNYSGKLSEDFVSNTLNHYKLGQGKVILIGKDGGIKSSLDFMDLEAIFLEIDAMPMRQIEMQN